MQLRSQTFTAASLKTAPPVMATKAAKLNTASFWGVIYIINDDCSADTS